MILLLALITILIEAIGEAILKRYNPSSFIFNGIVQWVIAIALFGLWFVIAYSSDKYYVPVWKLTLGFIFVRFLVFDVVWNLVYGVKWNYYGNKLYDRIMFALGSWGWFMKVVLGIVGIVFLLGLN